MKKVTYSRRVMAWALTVILAFASLTVTPITAFAADTTFSIVVDEAASNLVPGGTIVINTVSNATARLGALEYRLAFSANDAPLTWSISSAWGGEIATADNWSYITRESYVRVQFVIGAPAAATGIMNVHTISIPDNADVVGTEISASFEVLEYLDSNWLEDAFAVPNPTISTSVANLPPVPITAVTVNPVRLVEVTGVINQQVEVTITPNDGNGSLIGWKDADGNIVSETDTAWVVISATLAGSPMTLSMIEVEIEQGGSTFLTDMYVNPAANVSVWVVPSRSDSIEVLMATAIGLY